MKYSLENYKILAERFNSQTFLHKIITIKNNSELFYIESDGYNIRLRLFDEEAMKLGIDSYFSFPEFLGFNNLKDIFSLSDIHIKELK